MKNAIVILFNVILFTTTVYAQTDPIVYITTIGSGTTIENAKISALRSALEQVSGTYLSANTLVINDKLIADNISTITTGSIKHFDILEQNFVNNLFIVTVKSEILPNKFAEFVSGKGGSKVELKGGLFAANIKQLDLSEKAELEAIKNLGSIYNDLVFSSIYYKLQAGTPFEKTSKSNTTEKIYVVPLDIEIRFDLQIDSANKFLTENLEKICLNSEDITSYNAISRKIYRMTIDNKEYWFRNYNSRNNLLKINKEETKVDYLHAYTINDGKKSYYYFNPTFVGELGGCRPGIFIENYKNYEDLLYEGRKETGFYYDDYEKTTMNNKSSSNEGIITINQSAACYFYFCQNNFPGIKYSQKDSNGVLLRFHDGILLWSSDESIKTRLNGYYRLNDLELIGEININKNEDPYFRILDK